MHDLSYRTPPERDAGKRPFSGALDTVLSAVVGLVLTVGVFVALVLFGGNALERTLPRALGVWTALAVDVLFLVAAASLARYAYRDGMRFFSLGVVIGLIPCCGLVLLLAWALL